MRPPLTAAVTVAAIFSLLVTAANALGSASTLAVAYGSGTVCGVPAAAAPQSVQCARVGPAARQQVFGLQPNISFESVAGGRDFLCGLRSGGGSFFCWYAGGAAGNSSSSLPAKRVYVGRDSLSELSVGYDQVCAVDNNATGIRWWRGDGSFPSLFPGDFKSLTSGRGFSCGINTNASVLCWGARGHEIQSAFTNISMASIVAGDSHMCGIDTGGVLLCKGSNSSGQLDAPLGSAFEFSRMALGSNHSCALRQSNDTVLCWGGGVRGSYTPVNDTSFVLIVAGGNLTCGVTTGNLSVVCWGAGQAKPALSTLPLPRILPGICTAYESSCRCGLLPDSESFCSGSGVICKPEPCFQGPIGTPPPVTPISPPPPPPTSNRTSKGWLAFAIVGSVGAFVGVCTVLYCIWKGVCRHKKVHNSVQPTIAGAPNAGLSGAAPAGPMPSPFTSPNGSRSRFRRQSSRAMMKRQRSGPSSFKDRGEHFSFSELAAATKDFSLETKIGAGSFGTVYRGKLPDGREVAIKRGESGPKTRKFQEKESAFQSELAFLSRLHHKHLVGLVGFCEEREERLLVYDYMKNGALYDHLHGRNGNGSGSSESPVLNSWKIRIKVLLDASRGIEYLHNYAVPPIIHRDIKSSNILLDGNWTARVSDFGLSLMGPEGEGEHVSTKAAGTVGYMDPEYYGLHHLTVKSDVYGLGVVMLEVLTGKRAIFKDEESGNPTSVVDYAVPSIVAGEVGRVLDSRAGPSGAREAEAVELVAYTAVHCVSLEGRERPTMTDVVANLESALALCEESHGSISSASISLTSID